MTQTSYLLLPPCSRCYADPLAMNAAAIGEPVALVAYPNGKDLWRTGAISQRPTLDRMDGDSPVLRFENDDSMTWLGMGETT